MDVTSSLYSHKTTSVGFRAMEHPLCIPGCLRSYHGLPNAQRKRDEEGREGGRSGEVKQGREGKGRKGRSHGERKENSFH